MKASIQYRGAKLAYRIQGKGRCIVLLHGFLGSKEIWKSYVSRLSKQFKVIAVDLPGHGDSENLGYLHNMELLADAIRHLLQKLKIRKSIFVGHSLGGYVSLAFAEKYPDALLGLVLINSSAKGDSKKRKNSRNQLVELVKKDRQRAIELLVPSLFNLKSRHIHWQIKKYLKLAEKCNEQSVIAIVEGMKVRKEREIVLKFAPFPYLFIHGKYDPIFSEREILEQTSLNSDGQYIILENASHMSILEAEERVFRLIKRFSKKQRLV